ncbi:MAG: hypothetical protein P8M70_14410 [Verrucomicrobiota bacterium]|nr:hypothetical protein [Verrucomicrobiota bacterium]
MVQSVIKSTGINKAEILRAVTQAGLLDLRARYLQGNLDPIEIPEAIQGLWSKIEKKTCQNMEDGDNADEVLGIAMAEAERNILAHPQLSHIVNSIVDRRIAEERAKGYAPQVPLGENPQNPNALVAKPMTHQKAEPVTEEEHEKLREFYKSELSKLDDTYPSGTEMIGEEKVGLKKPDKP